MTPKHQRGHVGFQFILRVRLVAAFNNPKLNSRIFYVFPKDKPARFLVAIGGLRKNHFRHWQINGIQIPCRFASTVVFRSAQGNQATRQLHLDVITF
jgi:hypothetical protein